MANQYVNKVDLADGTVLIDISGDTVESGKLLAGYTAHDASGAEITGTWSLQNNVFTIGSLWATEDSELTPRAVLGFGTWEQISPIEPTWNRLKQTSTWAQMQIDAPTVYVWKRLA